MNVADEKLLFVTFCVEMYARRHEIPGEEAMKLFDSLGVCEFLLDSYDPLHSQDREVILNDVELFMKGVCEHD